MRKVERLRLERLKREKDKFKKAAKKQILSYITAAFGLVAGLAWNEAIKALIEYIFPLSQNSVWAKFIYAIVMTLVVVLISLYLVRLFKKEK